MGNYNISIIIVCKNEEDNIDNCLDSICNLDYPKARYEVIMVDNNSTDNTLKKIKAKQNIYENVRLELNNVDGIARSRNIGLRLAKFSYVAFTDADCVVPSNWLRVLVDGYYKYSKVYPKLVAVGGRNIFPEKSNRFQRAASVVLHSFWGSHTSTQGRIYKRDRLVRHIPTVNILYNKETLLAMDGFDEGFGNICEDVELNHRLYKADYKFIFLKDSFIWHDLASNLKEWIKKVFTYGKGRMWVINKHPNHFNLKFLIPPVLAFILVLSLFLGAKYRIFLIPLIYFPFILLISVLKCIKKRDISLSPLVFLVYVITHLSYSFGEYYGVFKKRR